MFRISKVVIFVIYLFIYLIGYLNLGGGEWVFEIFNIKYFKNDCKFLKVFVNIFKIFFV